MKVIQDSVIKQRHVDITHKAPSVPLVYCEFLPTHHRGSLLKPPTEVHVEKEPRLLDGLWPRTHSTLAKIRPRRRSCA